MKPKFKKTFVIRDRDVVSRITSFLEAQPLEPLLEITVKLHQKDRSILQNSLYWIWTTIVSDEWGWTKDDVHEYFKKKHLVKIYERDEEGYSAMIQAVRLIHTKGMKQEAKAMGKEIIRLTSTTSATVKQFTEYLKDIEKEMISKGFSLPRPEDQYHSAMGTKQQK